uniref:Zelda n=1 Tax=Blattella germanica TaxID=6973 RepID=A0A2P9A981_BLAGE|nr:Zelda [Blattella germanica]
MEGHHCKDCGLNFDSVKSLDVHLHYHKENLLMKWGQPDEANNNNAGSNNKRVTMAPADSSDGMVKQEPGHSSSPQPGYNHPPTPGSYSSAPSPYQDAFSTPSQQNGGTMNPYQQFGNYLASESFFMQQQQSQPPQNSETNYILGSGHDFPSSSNIDNLRQSTPSPSPSASMYRYHPYQQHYVPERNNGVSPSGPSPSSYQPPPTPQQCDKCGFVCHSSTALLEHLNTAHPPSQSPAPFIFPGSEIKTEDKPAAEILDLDSHKVHHVFQPDEKAAAETNGRGSNPHSVSGMLWGAVPRQDIAHSPEFQTVSSPVPQPSMQFQRGGSFATQPHLQHHSVVSSLPPPPPSPQQHKNGGSQSSGNQSWKSNEARRPKTYNCSACNKWFTSSGHLKRHYNTTLHKNAVKQSGAPDPANQPVSNHHHPARAAEISPSPRRQSPAQILSMTEDSSRSDDANSNGNLPTLNQQATSPPNLMAGPPISMEAQTEGLPFFTSNESTLLHNPSISVHTSPQQEPALLPPMQPQHTTTHPYTLPQVASPQVASPPAHQFIHHPIPQHQIRHPTPPSTLPMTEMFSPNGQPPHISTHQQHQQMLPISINHHHLIPTTGNYGSNGDAVSVMQEAHQFLYPVNSTPQHHENSPLPSFAQFGHHGFGANVGFGELTSSYPNFGMVNVESGNMAIDNVGGLLNSDSQHHLLVTMKQDDTFWMNGFVEQDNMLDDGSNTFQSDSNTSVSSISPAISPQSDEKEESKITTTTRNEMPLKAANRNINNNNNNNTIKKNKNGQIICIECDKVFNKACYLTQHNKSFHAGHKPYKCDRCGKRFTTECMYTEHLGKHAGEKPHKCDACPKQFNHKTDLRRHMCLHTGEKPFTCDICKKGFIRKDHMLKHCETHRRKTGHHHQNNHLKNLSVVTPVERSGSL